VAVEIAKRACCVASSTVGLRRPACSGGSFDGYAPADPREAGARARVGAPRVGGFGQHPLAQGDGAAIRRGDRSRFVQRPARPDATQTPDLRRWRHSWQGPPILVFLGDYIDRGFQSKEVLDLLLGDLESSFETYFLKGNHEEAMLQFLDTPSMGPRWADFGGMETLVSYGVAPPPTRTSREDWAIASCSLNRALPPGHLDFLMSLRLSIQIGGYMFVHAGVRPGVDLAEQSERDLLWIREEFLGDSRPLGAVIVHGHTPAIQPHRDSRRIGIDTGAYLSGRLTAVRLEDDAVAFLSTGPATEFEEGSGTKPEVWS
jgi:serine/threonine protein phosphatase 1